MFFRHILVSLCTVLLAATVSSCSGLGKTAQPSEITPTAENHAPVELAGVLPPLSQLKNPSWEVSEWQYGSEAALRGGDATGIPDDTDYLTLASTPGEISWGIWQYTSTDAVTGFELYFEPDTESECWLAIADFSMNTWSFDGPYTEDFTAALDTASHRNGNDNTFVAAIVFDGQFASVEEVKFVGEHDNIPPVADITASWTMGYTPMYVVFDASGSSDSDGSIVLYEWDFDGDGSIDSTGGAIVSYTYTEVGTYEARVTVTDNRDPLSDTATITIEVGPNIGPVAELLANPLIGDAPLSVDLDASGSSDADGSVVDYEWDFNGNGVFNEAGAEEDNRGSATPAAQEYSPGLWFPRVRVTDDKGSYGYATSEEIRAHGWHTRVLSTFKVASYSSMASVGGYPIVADISNFVARRFVAQDLDGYSWSGAANIGSPAGDSIVIADINGVPAVAYYDYQNFRLMFVLAQDAAGSSWKPPVVLDNANGIFSMDMRVVNGVPAVVYSTDEFDQYRYVYAMDATAETWHDPVVLAANDANSNCSLFVVDGSPAVAYMVWAGNNLMYIRASDVSGAAWGTAVTVVAGSANSYPQLLVADGYPAISYAGGSNNLMYVGAQDAQGSTWGTPIPVDTEGSAGSPNSMAMINGRPAIAYRYTTDGDLRYVEALDDQGSAWGTPVSLETAGNTGNSASLIELDGGYPAICHIDYGTPRRLLFTRLY